MTETKGNGNWLSKIVAVASISVLFGMGVQTLREPKDNVTQHELALQLVQLQSKIDTLSNEVAALRQSVNQQSTDIAGIAEKVGVTAHPVTAPGH